MDSLFPLKQCNLRYICASDSIKFNVWHVRFHKVDEFSICCFAGLEKLSADGFEAGVTVRREEARGCSCPLLCIPDAGMVPAGWDGRKAGISS